MCFKKTNAKFTFLSTCISKRMFFEYHPECVFVLHFKKYTNSNWKSTDCILLISIRLTNKHESHIFPMKVDGVYAHEVARRHWFVGGHWPNPNLVCVNVVRPVVSNTQAMVVEFTPYTYCCTPAFSL